MDSEPINDFKALQVRLASPEEILSWSHGEVLKSETINYRTFKPEKDGLFCERIFGPTRDWECYCGKYKRRRYEGVICDKCGVEVTRSRVRRERMGHISLAAPCAHVWYFKGSASPLSILLGVSNKYLQGVIYFTHYLVISVDEKERGKVLANLGREEKEEREKLELKKKQLLKKIKDEAREEEERVKKRIKSGEARDLALREGELQLKRKIQQAILEKEKQEETLKSFYQSLVLKVKKIGFGSFISGNEMATFAQHGADSFFEAKMGSEAVLEAVGKINLSKELARLRRRVGLTESEAKRKKLYQRIALLTNLLESGVDPSWMILEVLPVLPPDLRPMVQLSGGKFASSDLNDLYRRVLNRNNRLKSLMEIGAPEIILRNEKRMLQEAVDNLIDASQIKRPRASKRTQLRSLSESLRGKKGRFRQNLLGKRVDYSGRSVIVVGPKLNLNQCGLPKEMALEIFKPYLLHQMILEGIAPNIRSAKATLDRRPPEVYEILNEIIKDKVVVLNRAPTLHKLSLQAFYPVLVDGLAIQLHPCVCSGFNADFDGDQMAVHLPLSQQAQEEAKNFMLPQKNLLKPADGAPVSVPTSKEMALGIYYLTTINSNLPQREEIMSEEEAFLAYQAGKINLRQKINFFYEGKVLETTVGRIIFNQILPSEFRFVNEAVDSKVLKSLLSKILFKVEEGKMVEIIDAVKTLGFWAGTLSGLSFGIADNVIHPEKEKIIKAAEQRVLEIERSFNQGLITANERRELTQNIWIETTDELADKTWELFPPDSSVRLIIDAKVGRASRDNVKQLSAMRGLSVDPLGRIVPLPTKSNFREGLAVFEYVTSARGSRKGLTDTALKTADAGYLTRRLVDAAHDMIVRQEDCGTKKGIEIKREGARAEKFAERLLGRFLAADLKAGGKTLFKKGELLDDDKVDLIVKEEKITSVLVRSPLTCKTHYGVCQRCYGWNFANKKLVEIGTPVGILAAQSIGEPGTQLTLKTKHSGGVLGVDVTQGLPRVEELFEIRLPKSLAPLAEIDGEVRIREESGGGMVVEIRGKEEKREYFVPPTNQLLVHDKEKVLAGTQLAAGALDVEEVLKIRGLRAAQEYLLDSIQGVYESQNISINDRHFEVIIRRMSDKVEIVNAGDTKFIVGSFVDLLRFRKVNEKAKERKIKPAQGKRLILGLTKVALYTDSWLSAASFQETVNVLTQASLEGRVDNLVGMKENVIIGRLIPVSPEQVVLEEDQLEF